MVVFNAAVGGYDTCQEAWLLRTQLAQADPDLVLQQVCHNDLPGSTVLYPTDDGNLTLRQGELVRVFPAWIVHSRLTLSATLRWNPFGAAARADAGRPDHALGCLHGMAVEAHAAGVPLVTAHFPGLGPLAEFPEAARDERALLELYRQAGITAIELRPLLEAKGPLDVLRAHPKDPIHVGGEASRIVGEVIADEVQRLGLLAGG